MRFSQRFFTSCGLQTLYSEGRSRNKKDLSGPTPGKTARVVYILCLNRNNHDIPFTLIQPPFAPAESFNPAAKEREERIDVHI